MGRKKSPRRLKRPTKLEYIKTTTIQNNIHLHSASVQERRELLQFEERQVNDKIITLLGAVTKAKQRRNELHSMMLGLTIILQRR